MRADLDLLNEFWLRTEREKRFSAYAADLRRARPFALDDEIDEMVGELAYRNASGDDVVRRYLAAARLPYPVMWIEHGDAGFGRRRPASLPTMFGDPVKTGWLLTQQDPNAPRWSAIRVSRVVNDSDGELTASIYPLVHFVDPEGRLDYASWQDRPLATEWADVGRQALQAVHTLPSTPMIGWGGADNDDITMEMSGEAFDDKLRASPLYGTAALMMEPSFIMRLHQESPLDPKTAIIDFIRGASTDHVGELRYLVAALALLNEVPVEFKPYRPSGNARAGGRLRPFLSSSVVSITVPASRRRIKDIDRLLQTRGEANKKARHEVRGHYRHANKLPAKNPERWERAQDRDGRAVWRTWINHHIRGSAALGWVEQKYAVVPKHAHSEKDRLTEDRRSSSHAA